MLQVLSYNDYKLFLGDCLELKKRQNALYSLRAFARDLGMNPAQLSEVLNRKKGLSPKSAARIAENLKLGERETLYFCDLVRSAHAKDPAEKKVVQLRMKELVPDAIYQNIQLDSFRVISDWWHFAILELTFAKGFKNDARWISRKLGITVSETREAILRLTRLGLLSESSGKLKKTDRHLTTTINQRSDAIQKFNHQILEKAREALVSHPIEKRDFSTMTMAIDPKKIAAAQEILADCRRKVCDLLEAGEQSEVYCLSMQLFSLEKGTP